MGANGIGARFEGFVELIARLRAPGGCPWDREQTHASLKPMTIEEAYEVLEAIDEGDDGELAGELGDLLLQVVFHAQIASEERRFDVGEVLRLISEKMVRPHPHVFADDPAATPDEVLRNWEALKAEERRQAGREAATASLLDSVSGALPAGMEAFQVSTKAARVGFDWPDAAGVLAKLREELDELEQAAAGDDPRRVYEELGDVLFSAVNAARLLQSDPESALKAATRRFRRRFRHIEDRLRESGRGPAGTDAAELEALWQEAKALDRRPE